MRYLPIFFDVRRRPVLVVGGGAVALRKIRLLWRAGARVTVVAPRLCPALDEMQAQGAIVWRQRRFRDTDVEGTRLVYAAVDDRDTQGQVARAAKRAGIPVNVVDNPEAGDLAMPALVDRSPVLVAVGTAGASPVLARRLRAMIERIVPSHAGVLAELARRYRQRIGARIRDVSSRRRFHEWLVDGPVDRLVAAGRREEAESAVETALETGVSGAIGHVSLVGAGPGGAELLTLKALQRLQQADVVVHDGLVDDDVLEQARRDATFVDVTKRPRGPSTRQEDINRLLVERARRGEHVVRLKGGDPFVFGRGGEELAYLTRNGVTFDVVPGITAAAGCAAHAGIPLTHRDHSHSLWLVTGHGEAGVDRLNWRVLARSRQTLAFYMGVRRIPTVRDQLLRHGRDPDTPVAFVENGCRDEQRVITARVATMAGVAEENGLHAPAMIYVGEVAGFAREFHWYGRAVVDGAQTVEGEFNDDFWKEAGSA